MQKTISFQTYKTKKEWSVFFKIAEKCELRLRERKISKRINYRLKIKKKTTQKNIIFKEQTNIVFRNQIIIIENKEMLNSNYNVVSINRTEIR